MRTPTIAFFNNKGGVGKTSLVYHLGWMFSKLGWRTLVADFDPQANLTAAFLDEDRLERIWMEDQPGQQTIYGAIQPLIRGIGDVLADPHVEAVGDDLFLMSGDLELSRFEDELSESWSKCLDSNERAFRVMSALWRVLQYASHRVDAHLVLIDLGPNLGAINRSGLLAADHLVVPLVPDLFSLQGLKNLGPTLRKWRQGWQDRLGKRPRDLDLPGGEILPAGYIVIQHAVRLDRPTKAYEKWVRRIPGTYASSLLGADSRTDDIAVDEHCLALLKHYRSLMPMAQEARKPIFDLRAADGALGGHQTAAQDAGRDFERLARRIANRCRIAPPDPSGSGSLP